LPRIHPTAEVSPDAQIGEGTSIWNQAQVREGAVIGENCILSKDVYIDFGVHIGNNCKIQNGVSVYHGVTLEDGVFVGPYVCFTNDKYPRAINPDGSLKGSADWAVSETRIKHGAALGARSVILPGLTIGEWSMIAAGAVVTRDVPAYGLMVGHPARLRGFVCSCGVRLERGDRRSGPLTSVGERGDVVHTCCPRCTAEIDIPLSDWQKIE
jgi:UDP-2-acetamido-3-amino-2,3-dideoxy-glucuronate N-acetyltransferase